MLEQIGRYRIVRELGRGAMGLVYLADDPVLNRQVAIKMLDLAPGDPSQQEFLRERLLRDAKAAALLSHPNIVSVHDIVEDAGHAYVVMEYVPGESLAAYLKKQPVPAPDFTIAILHQMAAALDSVHARGIVHRDVKPGNVMIAPGGKAMLLDFGIARFSDARTTTPTGMVMGTVEYMAPEQIKGETVDGRADQFSLAALAYQMLSGGTMYGQHGLATLAYKLVNEKPAPIRSRNATLPEAVDAVFDRALAKSPAARYQSCTEFAGVLASALGKGQAASRPRRLGWVAAAVGGILLSGAGLAVWKPWSAPAPVAVIAPPVKTNAVETPPPAVKESERKPTKPPVPKATPPKKLVESSKPLEPIDSLLARAKEQAQSSDREGALTILGKAIALYPSSAQAYHARGLIEQNLDRYEPAIQDFSQAVRLNPNDALSFADRGICYNREHKEDLAFGDFNRALELRPDLAAALHGRALIYLRRQKYAAAIQDCDAALRKNPRFWPAYQTRGRAKRATGDEAGAQGDLKKARELRGLKAE